MIEAMRDLPEHFRRPSPGIAAARWPPGTGPIQLGTPVYFCDPHSPWQRGSNENTNRLLRFWFEKGSDLSGYTKADIKRIQDKLNTRPRPTLDLDTPAQRLAARIHQGRRLTSRMTPSGGGFAAAAFCCRVPRRRLRGRPPASGVADTIATRRPYGPPLTPEPSTALQCQRHRQGHGPLPPLCAALEVLHRQPVSVNVALTA